MSDGEWVEFTLRLFTEYPSLHDRLKRSAVDYKATIGHWRKKLSRYTAAELNAVLDKWDSENTIPWDSYAIEQAPAVIASVASNIRGHKSERERVAEMVNDPRSKANRAQTNDGSGCVFSYIKGSMCEVFETLRPLNKKMLDGEITEAEYQQAYDREMAKL